MHDVDSRVFVGVVLCYVYRAIAATIIYDNNLNIAKSLIDTRLKAARNVGFYIISRDNDRESRSMRHLLPLILFDYGGLCGADSSEKLLKVCRI